MGNRFLTQLGLFISGAVVVIISTLVGHHSQDQDYRNERERAVQQVAFLSVAGGDATGDGTSIANTLGRDIDAWLDDGRELQDFRGMNNRYGGITDAIGYDPFDESGLDCDECGPLSADTQQDILATREGNNLDVAFPEAPEPINWLPTGAIWWTFGGPIGFLIAVQTNRRQSLNLYRDLYVGVPFASKLMAGPLYLPVQLLQNTQDKVHAEKLRNTFPIQMETVDEVTQALEVLDDDDPRWGRLWEMREEVLKEIEAQCSSAPTSAADLDRLMAQLEDSREYVTVRRDVLKELSSGQSQPG